MIPAGAEVQVEPRGHRQNQFELAAEAVGVVPCLLDPVCANAEPGHCAALSLPSSALCQCPCPCLCGGKRLVDLVHGHLVCEHAASGAVSDSVMDVAANPSWWILEHDLDT